MKQKYELHVTCQCLIMKRHECPGEREKLRTQWEKRISIFYLIKEM